jgi:hypothetical protein
MAWIMALSWETTNSVGRSLSMNVDVDSSRDSNVGARPSYGGVVDVAE